MTTWNRGRPAKNRKLVVVGDGVAGKTGLLYAFKDDTSKSTQAPTIFDTYVAEVQLDNQTVSRRTKVRPVSPRSFRFSDRFNLVRYGRSRKFRSTPSVGVSRHEHRADVFQRRSSGVSREYSSEVESRSSTFLWSMSDDCGGVQHWCEERSWSTGEIERSRNETRFQWQRTRNRRGHQGWWLHGMFSEDARRNPRVIRTSCAVIVQNQRTTEARKMSYFVILSFFFSKWDMTFILLMSHNVSFLRSSSSVSDNRNTNKRFVETRSSSLSSSFIEFYRAMIQRTTYQFETKRKVSFCFNRIRSLKDLRWWRRKRRKQRPFLWSLILFFSAQRKTNETCETEEAWPPIFRHGNDVMCHRCFSLAINNVSLNV